ncbi:3105_t:CDS:1, partial [Paraglomus brasilianum]
SAANLNVLVDFPDARAPISISNLPYLILVRNALFFSLSDGLTK